MILRIVCALPALFLVLAPLGCSSYHKVEGTVTMDGAPVADATVIFMPTFEGGQSASGLTDANGKFKLTSPTSEKGVGGGTYKVIITKPDPDEEKSSVRPGGDLTASMAEWQDKHKGAKGVSAPVMPKSGLNQKYAKADTTPITISVPVSGTINFKLDR